MRVHHVEHAVFLCRWLIACGDEVVFVAWKPHALLAPLTDLPVSMVYAGIDLTDDIGVEQHTIRGQYRIHRVIRRAIREARHHKAHAVHLLYLDWFLLGISAALAFPLTPTMRSPVYATMYWLYFHRPRGERRFVVIKAKYWLESRLLQWLMSTGRLRGLFVFSEETRASLVRRGLEREDVTILPDPIEVPATISGSAEARKRLGIPEDSPVFLFFGETRADKGPDLLLEALASVVSPCTVMFVGPPQGLTEADFATAASKIPRSVRLIWRLERVPEIDVRDYFAASDYVVLPYRRLHLGTSGAMQHAAIFGKPVIVSDVGVLGGIARQWNLGLVIEPESVNALVAGIEEMLSSPSALRAQWAQAGREYGAGNDYRVFGRLIRERINTTISEGQLR